MPGFGFGFRFSRRSGSQSGSSDGNVQVLYGPNIGPKGPKKIIVAVFNQADTGYCYETNNVAENLPAKWAARGVNTWKPGHPDVALEGRQNQMLAAVKAAGLMMIAAPKWEPEYSPRPDLSVLDLRTLAMTDPYWRTNWFAYQIGDEPDLASNPWSVYVGHANNMALGGVTKPTLGNFTRRVAIPSSSLGSGTISFYEAFNTRQINALSHDSYEWHLTVTDAPSATVTRTQPEVWSSPWHAENNPGWPRFTASVTGLAVHMQRNGPLYPGRSDSGLMPVQYPPIAFNVPPYTSYGIPIPAQPNTYAPGDKATGHYIATGRCDLSQGSAYPRGGQWQPGRYLRNEAWSGFVHGSSSLYLFPQAVGDFTAQGYVDTTTNTLVVTGAPVRPMIGGAMRVIGPSGNVGWIRRDNPQLSGTPRSVGTYALDTSKVTPVSIGSAGTPVTLTFGTEARPWGDDTNAENLAEFVNLVANLNRMQAHPTGGNLLIDTTNGGRRAFTVMRCPEVDGDVSLYKDDMTKAPLRAGYTVSGVPVLNAENRPPLWDFGWPMGFEGFRVTGDDGAEYSYIRSLSNGNVPTFFPGYAALGLPPRVFGPFELVGFRRVGIGTAVEMTGSSAVLKAGVDEGAATWFYIESSAITQNEGNSGTTAYAITIRRGGNTSGTNTVTATVSGIGIAPANASDFVGGSFPTSVLSFASGDTTKTFTVNVQGDTAAEFNETFKVALSAPSGGAALVASGKSELTCTITSDDAALTANFIWLGGSLSGAPAISGAPATATYLNVTDTSFVTRAGVKMRTIGAGFSQNAGAFGLPYMGFASNVGNGVEFELAAGSWEIAFLGIVDAGGGGTVTAVDDPAGLANIRYSYTMASASLRIVDTDGTSYTNTITGPTDAINNLTFTSPITVSDLGGGIGRLRFNGTAPFTLLSAIALRQV